MPGPGGFEMHPGGGTPVLQGSRTGLQHLGLGELGLDRGAMGKGQNAGSAAINSQGQRHFVQLAWCQACLGTRLLANNH